MPQAGRLRLVALVHMPLGHGPADDGARTREGAVLSAAASVVTTSRWARRTLLELYSLPGDRVHVAEPGVDAADLAPGTATAGALLSRRGGDPRQGPRRAARRARDDDRTFAGDCLCVGSLDRDPAFAEGLRRRVRDGGLAGRVRFPGPQTGADLARSYGAADLLVLASRAETYGMVVTEALARGLPVVAAEVGGRAGGPRPRRRRDRPGLLVPPGDPAALGAALRAWLGDAELRRRLRRAARERRASLSPVVDHHVRPSPASWRERRDDRRGRSGSAPNGSTCASPPTPPPGPRDLVEHLRRQPAGDRPPGDPRPRLRHRGDGPMARAAPAGAAALGPARPRRRTCWRSPPPTFPARPPTGPPSSSRRGCPTSRSCDPDELAGATLITASALLDLMTGDELAGLVDALRRGRMPGAADAVGRRPRRAGPGGSARRPRGGRVRRPPAPHDGRAAACSARTPSRPPSRGSAGWGPRCVVRPSPWRLGAAEADLAAEWLAGWLGAACEQEAELAAEADAYARRRLAQARAGQLAVTVGHADLLVLP